MMKPVITQSAEKNFRELEMCLDRYFRAQVLPVMKQVKTDLSFRQQEETSRYMDSASARLMEMNNTPGIENIRMDTVLHHTGEWNSKTAEDYLEMCREQLQHSEHLEKDLSLLASMWRRQVIDLIGREQYDAKSQALGRDLADAYVCYRMDSQMVRYLVEEKTPKHSMDYIMSKGMGESLLGLLSCGTGHSPMENYILEEAEKAYAPTALERGAGKALGFGTDVMTTFGFGSWASVGRMAACEVLMEGARSLSEKSSTEEREVSVEEYISTGVFGAKDNVLGRWQKEGPRMSADGSRTAQELNEAMDGRLQLLSPEFLERWALVPDYHAMGEKKPEEPEISIPFLPGYDPNHPERYAAMEKAASASVREDQEEQQQIEQMEYKNGDIVLDEEVASLPQQQADGWGGMLSSLGLGDLGTVGRNMGYVISMLPDVMVGLFTGRTRSLDLKDNMLPLASVLVGLFVRNPLLKTLLIGMGGLNLLNKAGHEVVEGKRMADGVIRPGVREFRHYEDQELDPRMKDPEIKGNALFAVVDGVPSTIHLPPQTVAAWQAGALPINTLANAVLAKSDEMSRMARENYEERESRDNGVSRGL